MDVMIHYSQTSRRSCKELRIKQRNMETIITVYQIYLLVVLFSSAYSVTTVYISYLVIWQLYFYTDDHWQMHIPRSSTA